MNGLEFVNRLKPCTYQYRDQLDDGRIHCGFVAQDVAEVADEKIYSFTGKDKQGYYYLNLSEFISPIVDALQQIDKRLKALENKQEIES